MSRFWIALFTTALLVPGLRPVVGQLVPYGGAREYVQDLRERRAATMTALGAGTALVLWSAPRRVYSTDTDYEYRQESNLLYLTGLEEEAVTLVLVPDATGPREFLFVRAKDPFFELWNGSILSPEEVVAKTGITQVFPQRGTEALDAFFRGFLGLESGVPGSIAAAAGVAAAPGRGALRLSVLDASDSAAIDPAAARHLAWARERAATRPQTTVAGAAGLLERQRRVKTFYEQRVMRRAVEIAAEAHVEGMRTARPGRWEYEVEAAIEGWFLKSGAMSWGYPSIVGSGPNATILHYTRSTRQMLAGDLLLVDAGANFQGLTGDITRTYPVNGRFTAAQREIYDIVLEALDAGILAARPDGTVEAITQAVRVAVGRGLLRVGLVTDPAAATGRSAQIDLWFPHSPVHGIGIDVHESLGVLVAGSTFVVEPGIYVRPDTFARLASDPTQAELARALAPAVERFKNIGVRIEDSLLMTPGGPEIMSYRAPKRVDELERVVGTGR